MSVYIADTYPIFSSVDEIVISDESRCSSHLRRINANLKRKSFFEAIEEHLESDDFLRLSDSSRKTVKNQIRSELYSMFGRGLICDPVAGFAFDSFFKSFKWKAKRKAAGSVVSCAEIGKLLSYSGERTSLWIESLYFFSRRVSEVCNIRLSDIEDDGSDVIVIHFPSTKTEDRASILVDRELIQRIRTVFSGAAYLFETQTGKNYRRQDVYNLIVDSSNRILGKKITPHDLRRSFATHMHEFRPELEERAMRHGSWIDHNTYRNHYTRPPMLKPDQIPAPDWNGIRIGYSGMRREGKWKLKKFHNHGIAM